MNAHQRLWLRLATVIPAPQYEQILALHKEDLARDRRRSEYRRRQRYAIEAKGLLNRYEQEPMEYDERSAQRARERLAAATAWLEEHKDWI